MRRLAAVLGLVSLLVALAVVALLWSRSARELAASGIAPATTDLSAPAGAHPDISSDASVAAAGTPAERLRKMRRATDEHERELEKALEEVP